MEEIAVKIDAGAVVCGNYIGAGIHFAPYELEISDAAWARVLGRLEWMRPNWARVMITANAYVQGIDAAGRPVYDWDGKGMRGLYRMLDWCQGKGIPVIFGEWNAPSHADAVRFEGLDVTNPAWASMIADCLRHLRVERGYTCIKYYNLVNEPNGDWSGVARAGENQLKVFYARWQAGARNLYAEFKKRGYLDWISLSGPDTTGADQWVDWSVEDLDAQLGIYDLHRYDTVKNIVTGGFEAEMRAKRRIVPAHKAFTLNEAGIIDGKVAPDSQSLIGRAEYGLWIMDMVIQSARAGMAGQISWDLDDAQHRGGGYGSENLKKWGFWNSLGGTRGYPAADAEPRPWFRAWGLLSRYFPRGCQILLPTYDSLPEGFRAMAMRQTGPDGRAGLSIALVNESGENRRIRLDLTGLPDPAGLKAHAYPENVRVVAAEPGVYLMAPQSGLVLTTLD